MIPPLRSVCPLLSDDAMVAVLLPVPDMTARVLVPVRVMALLVAPRVILRTCRVVLVGGRVEVGGVEGMGMGVGGGGGGVGVGVGGGAGVIVVGVGAGGAFRFPIRSMPLSVWGVGVLPLSDVTPVRVRVNRVCRLLPLVSS